MQPLVSIVIANYNYGRFLEEAILSVVNQSCQDFELIVCDAASTDNSVEIIKKYADKISWWCSEKDGGQSAAFNKGFSRARGKFLTWLNADDVMCPGVIEKLKDAVEKYPDCQWFSGGFIWCDPNLNIVHCYSGYPLSSVRYNHGLAFVGSPSSFFTKELLFKAGGVDERFHYTMDTHLWLKFYYYCKASYRVFTDYAFVMRMHSDSKMGGHNFENGKFDPKTVVRKSKHFVLGNDKKSLQLRQENAWMQEVHPHTRMTFWQRLISIHWPSAIKGRLETRKWFGRHYKDFFSKRDCHGGKDAICQIGVVFPYGNLMSLSRCAVATANVCPDKYDFYYASLSRDVDKGAWDFVKSGLRKDQIVKEDTIEELRASIGELFESHRRVMVHCGGGYGQTKWLMPLIKKYGKRLILVGTTHSFALDSWKRIPMCLLQLALYLRYYRMIVFQCKYAVDKFIGSSLLFKRGNAVIVPLGCEELSDTNNCVIELLNEFSFSEVLTDQSLFKFVYLAHFRPGKNHVWLVRSIAPALRKHPEARLILCGQDLYGVAKRVQDVIKKEGLEEQIIMPGLIPRQSKVDCAIVASRAETFGFSYIEPMFNGLPVVGTLVGVGKEIIINEETGMFIDLKRPASLSRAVEYILQNKDHAREMGSNARMLVHSRFTYSAVAQKLVTIYAKLFEG